MSYETILRLLGAAVIVFGALGVSAGLAHFVLSERMKVTPYRHPIRFGWTANETLDATAFQGENDRRARVTLQAWGNKDVEFAYLWLWRSNVDGGRPDYAILVSSLNQWLPVSEAYALSIGGVRGKAVRAGPFSHDRFEGQVIELPSD